MEDKHKEIDLNILWQILKLNKKIIFISTGFTTLVAVIYCLVATPIFTGDVVINPPKLSDTGSGLSSILGLAALANVSSKSDADITIAMLHSREVLNQLIDKFNLINYYHAKDIDLARIHLLAVTNPKIDLKSGFVTIDVDDKSPQLACAMANYYTVALGKLISQIGFDQVANKKDFYEKQLIAAKEQLTKAQAALRDFANAHGITAGLQTNIVVGVSTQLEAQLAATQTQLRSMQLYATENNPDYKQLQAQVNSLKSQLLNLSGTKANSDEVIIPANLAPEFANRYTNLAEEVAFRDQLYKIFMQQFEISRIDALSDEEAVTLQVIDKAIVPIYKSKPKRLQITLISMLLGIFISSLYIVIKNRKKIIILK